MVEPKGKKSCPEGDYLVAVSLKGGKSRKEGWIEFKPTHATPNVVQFVTQKFAAVGEVVERIEVKKTKTKLNGKKWIGVFYQP